MDDQAKTMRIGIAQGAFLPVPPIKGGAVEKVWHSLGRKFAEYGNTVTHVSRAYEQLSACEVVEGVEHRRVKGADTPASLVWLKAMDLLYSFRAIRSIPQVDVLVTNTFWLPMLLRLRSRGNVYVHVARRPRGQMRFYGNAARLHAVSQSVATAIGEEAPRLRDRIRIIPYPVTIGANGVSESRLPNAERRKKILFVGRLHPEKGVHVLIGAFACLPEAVRRGWCLEVVGPEQVALGGGGAGYLSGLVQLAVPVKDSVHWGGAVFDASRLAEIYKSARVFVYPSLAEKGETFGLAPLEAMSFGCVPVVSRLSCFNEYVDDGVCGVAFDHSGSRPELVLAAVLAALMRNEGRVEKLAAAAFAKAQNFSLERIARMHMDDFSEVLEESRSRSAGRSHAVPSIADR